MAQRGRGCGYNGDQELRVSQTMNIFVSYAFRDSAFAVSLAEELVRQGHRAWVAHRNLLPGDNWALETGKALEASDAMIVLLSPDSAGSEAQRHEIDYALSSNQYAKRVFPVFIGPTKDYPWILDRFVVIHANNSPLEVGRKIGQLLRKAG
jgi:hypothetical protein